MSDIEVYSSALACGVADWVEIFGDPILRGTVFMLAYGIAAVLMLRVAQQSRGREKWLWWLSASLFLFQVVNTHLDLQGLVWATGRCLARAQGWYEERRKIQAAFVGVMATVVLISLLVTALVFRRHILNNLLLVSGVLIAFSMTAVRGINYQGLSTLSRGFQGYLPMVDPVEILGIALAGLAAWLRLSAIRYRKLHPRPRPRDPAYADTRATASYRPRVPPESR
ncbi:hypothetical protein [Tropicimonas sp.]|uniref:hypothetical protein n=1 Tax=Tropicimonas sp. TaxID=2067044 RepID=UPI003A85BB53